MIRISKELDIPILDGLVEKDKGKIFNTYICVTKDGIVAKYRKIHPFISKYMSAGQEYCVFDLFDWKCGILTCNDNNVIENVRATSFLVAELIFVPHATDCTPSAMPGRDYVDDEHLKNGNSMIIDPYGEVLSEIKSFEDDITISTITNEKYNFQEGGNIKMQGDPNSIGA